MLSHNGVGPPERRACLQRSVAWRVAFLHHPVAIRYANATSAKRPTSIVLMEGRLDSLALGDELKVV